MTSLLLLSIGALSLGVGGAPSPGGVIYAAAPEERGAFHVGGKGVYNYGYNTGDGIAKVEVRHPSGAVTGSYRYFDPAGRQIVRSYIADKRGFRVLGNELPVAPDTPALGFLEAQTLTGPVEGTQEFSSPNIVTHDKSNFFLQNRVPAQATTKTHVNNQVSEYQQRIEQQQKDIARQQEELIRQHKQKLAQLKLQQEQQQRQLDELRQLQLKQHEQQKLTIKEQQVQHTQNGYYSSFNNVFGVDSPYFFSEDNINYDFPAGFAYNAAPSHISNPVGVRGEHSKLIVTAGHTPNSYQKPVYNYYSNRKSPFQNVGYRHPYIIGQAR